jgi:hypothetical protein
MESEKEAIERREKRKHYLEGNSENKMYAKYLGRIQLILNNQSKVDNNPVGRNKKKIVEK